MIQRLHAASIAFALLAFVPFHACGGSTPSDDPDAESSDGSSTKADGSNSDGSASDGESESTSQDGTISQDSSTSDGGDAAVGLCKSSPLSYTVTASRGGNTAIYTRAAVYDYAPSVMKDGNTYHMWWCGGVAGDYILHAESASPSGPWHKRGDNTANTYDVALQPTGNTANFDGTHTCDPSVLRVGGTYYMYYGGAPKNTANSDDNPTAVGLATSTDGITWSRANGGQAIVSKVASLVGKPNAYGAGQPSVTYANGKYYLLYVDSSAPGSNNVNGAGAYVLRSADPTFQANVEELGASGFAARTVGNRGTYALQQAFSLDWMFAPEFDLFVVAQASNPAPDGQPRQYNLHFYKASNLPAKEGPNNGVVSVDAMWREGAGLITTPDKRALPGSPCHVMPVDLLRPVGPDGNPFTWDLAHSGWDITIAGK